MRRMTEAEGCELLHRVFATRGYQIARDVQVTFEGVSFFADGWDSAKRVGFEYLTHEAGDHADLDAGERQRLEMLLEAGKVSVFIIDETEVDEPGTLEWAAHRFLDAVEARTGRGS